MGDGSTRGESVTSVSIYIEGGGTRAARSRRKFRRGMEQFLKALKEAARKRSFRWKVVACGPRDAACRLFLKAATEGSEGDIVALLVDSEGKVVGAPRSHLLHRDGWRLPVGEDRVHLMVQTMETWLIADTEALGAYYGGQFNGDALPKHQDLERAPKELVNSGLARATRRTQKGSYDKIDHASELLKRVDPGKVKARCPHCKRLFHTLAEAIEAA